MLNFNIIAAMSYNRAIGINQCLPWYEPDDLKWFKQLTNNNILIMGHNTFKSLKNPLPNRKHFILTKSKINNPPIKNTLYINHLNEIYKHLNPEDFYKQFFICGGAQIYNKTKHLCNKAYITIINKYVNNADTFMPHFESFFDIISIVSRKTNFTIYKYSKL